MDAIIATALGLGALGVFALMIPESAGFPVPSEAVLLLAGAAVHHGHMPLWLAVLAGTAGNLVGSLALYGVGRRWRGRSPSSQLQARTRRCRALFDRYGNAAVFLGRLVPLARTYISLPAGAIAMPLPRFVILTTAGCALWSTAFVCVGAQIPG